MGLFLFKKGSLCKGRLEKKLRIHTLDFTISFTKQEDYNKVLIIIDENL